MKAALRIILLMFLIVVLNIILSGCAADPSKQNGDQKPKGDLELNENIINGIVDEAERRDMDIDVKNDGIVIESDLGSIMVDESDGSGYIIKTDDIEAVAGSGQSASNIPEDIPVLDSAVDIGWIGSNGAGIITYDISGLSISEACDSQADILVKDGWSLDEGVSLEFRGTSTRTLNKDDYILSLTCKGSAADENSVTVSLVKGLK